MARPEGKIRTLLNKPLRYPFDRVTIKDQILHPFQSPLQLELRKCEKDLRENPFLLETITQKGPRFDVGIVNWAKTTGEILYTDRGPFIDGSHQWFTQLLDWKRHKMLRQRWLIDLLGRLSLQEPTPTETQINIHKDFIDMMRSFWPEAKEVFTNNSGAQAVDDACWIACSQVARKLHKKASEMKGARFKKSFHGRYDWGAHVTESTPKVRFKQTNKAIPCETPINIYNPDGSIDQGQTDIIFNRAIKQVEKALKRDDTAFVIIEYPLQAEGGARVINSNTLKQLHDICQKYGKFLIVDCVQMGARAWHQKEDGSVTPFLPEVLEYADMITFGKGFHASGTMIKDFTKLGRGYRKNVYDTHPERWAGTWTGHVPQMLSGLSILKTILSEGLWKNALEKTKTTLEVLTNFTSQYPNLIEAPRGRPDTAYLGWDFKTKEQRERFKTIMLRKFHIVFLGAGDKGIRWAPNVDMTDQELKEFINTIEECLIYMQNEDQYYREHPELLDTMAFAEETPPPFLH